MRTYLVLAILAGMAIAGLVTPANAQTIPDVRGLKPFTAETNFMSLAGYLRFHYYLENNTWITRKEANSLVKSQMSTSVSAAIVK